MTMMQREPTVHDLTEKLRVKRLLDALDVQSQRTRYPSQKLFLDVDGEQIDEFTPALEPTELQIPLRARSVTLRDEFGTIRAFAMMDEPDFEREPFDGGRLLLSLRRADDDSATLHVSATQAAIDEATLAAESPDEKSTDDGLLEVKFLSHGEPAVLEGRFMMRAICDEHFTGKQVSVKVKDLIDLQLTVRSPGFINVDVEVPEGTPSRKIPEEDVTVWYDSP